MKTGDINVVNTKYVTNNNTYSADKRKVQFNTIGLIGRNKIEMCYKSIQRNLTYIPGN